MKRFELFQFLKRNKFLILFLILTNILIKLPLLLIPVDFADAGFYPLTGKVFLEGFIPYKDFIKDVGYVKYEPELDLLYHNSVHPNGPFNYFLYTFIILILGDSTFSIKIPILLSEIISAIMIYAIGKLIKSQKVGFYSALFYSLCSITFFPMLTYTVDEVISSAFVLSSIYLFLRKNVIPSSILLAIAASYKYYSILVLIPIFIFSIRNYTFKKFIKFFSVFAITILLISMPYLILCPYDFFYWNFSQVSRFLTVSFGHYISDSFLYINVIQFDFLSINVLNIIQISVVLASFIFFLKLSANHINEIEFLLICAFYTLILPPLTLTNNFRYYVWLFPFLCVPIIIEAINFKENQYNYSSVFYIIYFFVWDLIFLIIFPPFLDKYAMMFAFFVFLIVSWLPLNLYISSDKEINLVLLFAFFLGGASNYFFYREGDSPWNLGIGIILLYVSTTVMTFCIFRKISKNRKITEIDSIQV